MPPATAADATGGGDGGGDSFLSTLAALRASISNAPPTAGTNPSTTNSATTDTGGTPTPIITQGALQTELVALRSDLAASRSALGTTLSSHEQVVHALRQEIAEANAAQKAAEAKRTEAEARLRAAAARADEMQTQLSGGLALRKTLEEKLGKGRGILARSQRGCGLSEWMTAECGLVTISCLCSS